MTMRLILLGFIFLNFACSKIETGLSLAPSIVTKKIDSAFDFKSEKLIDLRNQINLDIQNSKKSLAKELVNYLNDVEQASKDASVAKVVVLYNSFTDIQTKFIKSFKSSAELTFKNLSDKEIDHFKKFSEKKYKEELEDAHNRKYFLKKKKKDFIKVTEFFYDDITPEEEKIISDFVETNLAYFEKRILIREKFSDLLYLKMKSKDVLLDLFLSNYSGKKIEEISDLEQKSYLQKFFQLQVDLWIKTTDKQKTHFYKLLNNYRTELQKISNG